MRIEYRDMLQLYFYQYTHIYPLKTLTCFFSEFKKKSKFANECGRLTEFFTSFI